MNKCIGRTHYGIRLERDPFSAFACHCGDLDEVLLDGSPIDFGKLDTRSEDMAFLQSDAEELLKEAKERLK